MTDLDREFMARLNDNCSRLVVGDDKIVRIKGEFVDDDMIFKLQYILQKLIDDPEIDVMQNIDGKIYLRYRHPR